MKVVAAALVLFAGIVGLVVIGGVALGGRWSKSRGAKALAKAFAAIAVLFIVYLGLATWLESCVSSYHGPVLAH